MSQTFAVSKRGSVNGRPCVLVDISNGFDDVIRYAQIFQPFIQNFAVDSVEGSFEIHKCTINSFSLLRFRGYNVVQNVNIVDCTSLLSKSILRIRQLIVILYVSL